MGKQFLGLTTKDVKRTAFPLAIKNDIFYTISGPDKKKLDGNIFTISYADFRN
jgi:hypothetical protein